MGLQNQTLITLQMLFKICINQFGCSKFARRANGNRYNDSVTLENNSAIQQIRTNVGNNLSGSACNLDFGLQSLLRLRIYAIPLVPATWAFY